MGEEPIYNIHIIIDRSCTFLSIILGTLWMGIVCFPSSNVFFEMFFCHMGLCFLDSCTAFCQPGHHSITSTSHWKMFCTWIFAWRNIGGKLLKAASFMNSGVTSNIIAGSWSNTWKISWSIDSLFNAPDVNGGFCPTIGTSKCTLLAHRIAFGVWLLDSDSQSPWEFDLSFFNYMPPPLSSWCNHFQPIYMSTERVRKNVLATQLTG